MSEGKSIRPRSLNGLPARRNSVREPAPKTARNAPYVNFAPLRTRGRGDRGEFSGKVARWLEHIPGINAWFRHQHRPIVPPTGLIPAGMEQVEYRELYEGQAWYLNFRKPR